MQSLMQDAKGLGKTQGIFVKVDSKAVRLLSKRISQIMVQVL